MLIFHSHSENNTGFLSLASTDGGFDVCAKLLKLELLHQSVALVLLSTATNPKRLPTLMMMMVVVVERGGVGFAWDSCSPVERPPTPPIK